MNWLDRENPQAGGAEQHLHEIFGRLVARGHEVDCLCSGWHGASRAVELDGMHVRRIGGRYSFALLGRGAVRRALNSKVYDVVVEDVNKVPLFLPTLTGLPFCIIVPHLFGTTAFAEAIWPVAAAVWLAERPLPRAYRRAFVHAISKATRDDLVARGVEASSIRVIYPGIDATWYTPDATVPRAARPTFLYVGRIRRYKGVDVAIRALHAARSQRQDLELDIAGSGADRPRLEGLVRRLGLDDAVTFHGFVSDETKRGLLRRAWANVYPSSKEGWGITNLEAAACGTPSIASNTSALRESVQNGTTGHLVPHGDIGALAKCMLNIAADPEHVDQLGTNARRFAETFSWDRTTIETETHLQECVAGGMS